MRTALWAALTFCAFAAGFYAPLCFYFCGGMIIFPTVCGLINLFDKSEIRAKSETVTAKKGETIKIKLRVFGNGTAVKGTIICENILTHAKSQSMIYCTAGRSGTELELEMSSKACGEIRIMLTSLRRYDFCRVTYKKMKSCSVGKVIVLPSMNGDIRTEIKDRLDMGKPWDNSGDTEISGSKEYADGNELKHINHKLTHRFGKLYIKEYSHEKEGKICLFFDRAYSGDPEAFDRLTEEICAASEYLTECGVVHYIGDIVQGEIRCEKVTAGNFTEIICGLLTEETFEGVSQFDEFSEKCDENISDMICFSVHDF